MRVTPLIAGLALLTSPGCALFGITEPLEVEHGLQVLECGIEIRDTLLGEGAPAEEGQELVLDYSGFLSNGSQFDSSLDRGIPIRMVLGEAPLKGWDLALVGMRAGGLRYVRIPPELAYGEAGVEGMIPPNETLVFEFELHEIH